VPVESAPKRETNVGHLKPGGRYLVEERLKYLVVVAVDEGHPHGGVL
jgi:hypothetical protein